MSKHQRGWSWVLTAASCAVAGVMPAAGGCASNHTSNAVPASAPARPAHSATTAAPRAGEPWMQRHLAIVQRVRDSKPDLVFIGDSITQGWEDDGAAVWSAYYGTRAAANAGIGGDRTQHVLWRLENGLAAAMMDHPPRAIVLMIGTNNSNGSDNTAAEIAGGIVAIVQDLRRGLPDTHILLLDIFPRGATPDAQREKNAQASAIAWNEVKSKRLVHRVEIGDRFVNADGSIDPAVMPDFLHLSERGYSIWAEAIEPTIREIMR